MAHRPRVLVTRAAQQGSELAGHLRSLGAEPLLLPMIETVEPSSFAALDQALGRLHGFDWLIFTSANAVEVFARRSAEALPPYLRIAAIGAATCRAIKKFGWPVDLVPEHAVAEALAHALLSFAQKTENKPIRFLLVRAEEGRDVLPQALREAGAEVVEAPAYRTIIPEAASQRLREVLSDPRNVPDAITFTSSSTARNLFSLCESAGLQLPETSLRVSIGPITSQTMLEWGLPAHAEAPEASVASLAGTVMRVLSNLNME